MFLNTCTFMGRLSGDPEIRYYESGRFSAQFNLAVNTREKDRNGEYITLWLTCGCWSGSDERGSAATITNNFEMFQKGSQVIVSGEMTQDNWIDKTTGSPRSKPKLNVSVISLVPYTPRKEKIEKELSSVQPETSEVKTEENSEWDLPADVKPKAETKAKSSAYASTASKGKELAYAGGDDQLDDIPF